VEIVKLLQLPQLLELIFLVKVYSAIILWQNM
jgi:hypothetical protein